MQNHFFTKRTVSKEHVIGVIAHENILRKIVMKMFELFIFRFDSVYVSTLSMPYLSVNGQSYIAEILNFAGRKVDKGLCYFHVISIFELKSWMLAMKVNMLM